MVVPVGLCCVSITYRFRGFVTLSVFVGHASVYCSSRHVTHVTCWCRAQLRGCQMSRSRWTRNSAQHYSALLSLITTVTLPRSRVATHCNGVTVYILIRVILSSVQVNVGGLIPNSNSIISSDAVTMCKFLRWISSLLYILTQLYSVPLMSLDPSHNFVSVLYL